MFSLIQLITYFILDAQAYICILLSDEKIFIYITVLYSVLETSSTFSIGENIFG